MEKKYVFPKVDLPEVARSNHNLDKAQMISFSPGTARWLWGRDVLPNDHWEISLSASIESLPMLAPLYGSFKATWAFYFEPWSNIYGWMDNNKRQSTEKIIGQNLIRYSLPIIDHSGVVQMVSADSNFGDLRSYHQFGIPFLKKVSPSCIWEDFGWPTDWYGSVEEVLEYYSAGTEVISDFNNLQYNPGFSINDEFFQNEDISTLELPRTVKLGPKYLHGVKPLAYLDIIRNYYVNNQMNVAAYITANPVAVDSTYIGYVEIEVLDYIFAFVRSLDSSIYHTSDYDTLSNLFLNKQHLNGYSSALHQRAVNFLQDWEQSYTVPNGGCFLTNYQMDLNRGLLATSVGNYHSVVDTSSGSFSIDTLRMQNKVQQLIDILDLTGGRFSDWVRALWSVNIKGDVDKPIYIGSFSQNISTTDIVSPSTTAGSTAGSQTGFAAGGMSNTRKITFNSDIYGTICCVFTYTPIVMYSNLFKREDLKTSFQDVYNPRMAQLGYQGVPHSVLSAEYSTLLLYDGAGAPPISFDSSGYALPFIRRYNNGSDEMNQLVGKQVAWAEYMSDIDEARGLFATNQSLEYWVLNRDYNYRKDFDHNSFYVRENAFDGSTYVDPAKWQNLFADVEPNAQNFRQFYKFNVFVKRPIPKRTLGRL